MDHPRPRLLGDDVQVPCAHGGSRRYVNLDGGGSTTLVHRRHLLNRPYSEQDQAAPASRPIVTALLLEPRR